MAGIQTHLPVPPEYEGPDVARTKSVAPDQLTSRLGELVDGIRNLHVVELCRALETLEMLSVPEHGRTLVSVVAPDALEDTCSVVKGMAQHVHLGVLPGHEFAVHPDPLEFFYS
jgi:hypothetical protein